MRIISGNSKGTKLYTLEGETTRPTLDRVKESIFNIIQNEIQDSIFIDVFSGSGQMGLEAASRGAKKVYLCEKSKEAIKIIKKNIEKTNLIKNTVLYNLDYKIFLENKIKEKPDIIYIDPPYKTNYAIDTLEILLKNQIISDKTLLILETDAKEIINQIDKIKQLEIVNQKKYGRAIIIFLKMK